MPSNSLASARHPLRFLMAASATASVAVALAGAATDPGIGWMIPLAVVGGMVIAAALIATQSKRTSNPSDSFQRAGLDSIIDISHVRVAGIGGLGLMAVASALAFEYQLIGAVLAAGAIGGAIAGVVVIHRRRRHPALPMVCLLLK